MGAEALFALVNNGMSLCEVDGSGQCILHLLANSQGSESDECYIRMVVEKFPFGDKILDLQDCSKCCPLEVAYRAKNWFMIE